MKIRLPLRANFTQHVTNTLRGLTMKRINQLITRLVIIALVALAVWVARMPLANRALSWHGSQLTGVRVDVGKLRLDRDDDTLFLNQLEIADPRSPSQNILQAEVASLKVDRTALIFRRLVIDEGRLSELKFGASRTSTGILERGVLDTFTSLPNGDAKSQPLPSVAVVDAQNMLETRDPRGDRVARLSQCWRDGLLAPLDDAAPPSFEVASITRELKQRWSGYLDSPRQRLLAVSKQLGSVEEVVETAPNRNPLRNVKQLPDASKVIQDSRRELESLNQYIEQIRQQSLQDTYALSQAAMRDQQSLAIDSNRQTFDDQLLNELLIGNVERQLVHNGLDWFQQFRDSIPDFDKDLNPSTRGTDLYFGADRSEPAVTVKSLQIDGDGMFANSYLRFAGTVENVSSSPRLQKQPTQFNLRAQGQTQIVVAGSLDRRSEQAVDSINFKAYDIPQPGYQLGDGGSVLLSMAPNSLLHVEANLTVGADQRISGQMKFRFDEVAMHADEVHADAGGRGTAALINETVSSISTFELKTQLGGTIEQPEMKLVSNLGPQVARALETVFANTQQLAAKKKERRLKQAVDQELTDLKATMNEGVIELSQQWKAQVETLNRLEKRISTAQGDTSLRSSGLR